MTPRLNLYAVASKAIEPLMAIEEHIKQSSLDPLLTHLVKIRASQINGCAYCLHMHTHDARELGEREERIYLLDAWQESRLYTPRERAALAWTETLTRIADTHAPDADYEAAAAEFSPTELVDLTLLITNINAWNRISVGFRNQHPRDKAPKAVAA